MLNWQNDNVILHPNQKIVAKGANFGTSTGCWDGAVVRNVGSLANLIGVLDFFL